ncbi:MAG: hypothetical protein GXO11_00340 [Epsilonproteobacteria bacterium]|nr:hypothetical protein [Campylobacterota bacterium]
MNKYLSIFLLLLATVFLNGCINRHGVSMKYYSDCKEYYDLEGFYHKECGEDDIFTYDDVKEAFKAPKKNKDLIEGIPRSNY